MYSSVLKCVRFVTFLGFDLILFNFDVVFFKFSVCLCLFSLEHRVVACQSAQIPL